MRLLKSAPILNLVNSFIVDSPQPVNLSYAWNFGSLLATCLGLQIVTGVLLAMHYTPNVDLAFVSVEHIMRDVNYGWLLRYTHANVASFFFIFVYAHIARGLYYGSYKAPRTLVWTIGVVILVLMMGIAFLGFHSLTQPDSSILTCSALPLMCSPRLQTILERRGLMPVGVFENLHLLEVRLLAQNTIRHLAGVYAVVNLLNGKIYVGSGVTGALSMRLYRHLISLTGSKIVSAAVIKYGLCQFAFVVLEVYPVHVTTDTNQCLLAREQYYLNTFVRFGSDYNVLVLAGYSLGYTHTDDTCAIMSSRHTPERREQVGDINRGRTLSPETRELIREQALQPPPMTEATRLKVSDNSTVATTYSVTRVSGEPFTGPNGTLVTEIKVRTLPVLASFLGCSVRTLARTLQKGNTERKGWSFVKVFTGPTAK